MRSRGVPLAARESSKFSAPSLKPSKPGIVCSPTQVSTTMLQLGVSSTSAWIERRSSLASVMKSGTSQDRWGATAAAVACSSRLPSGIATSLSTSLVTFTSPIFH
jgi:hypothetical protein